MIWFLGVLFVYAGMLVRAPAFTLATSGVFGGLLLVIYLMAYLTLTLRVFG
jgi:hypothetical protein